MRWVDKARDVAKEYKRNCLELRQIEEFLQASVSSSGGSPVMNGKISKPVEAAVERKMMQARYQYLRQAVAAVEEAMESVLRKPQGDLTLRLFNMVHYYQSHTLYGAALELNISEKTARRYTRYFLKIIAEQMGYINLTSQNEKDDLF